MFLFLIITLIGYSPLITVCVIFTTPTCGLVKCFLRCAGEAGCCFSRYLVELGCIKPQCDLLTVMDSKIVQVALNGLENILRLGEQEAKRSGSGVNPYCALIEEAYGEANTAAGNGFAVQFSNDLFILHP